MDISRRSPGEHKGAPERPSLLELMLGARLAIAAALAGVTVLCWLYLFAEAADMRAMGDMTMAMPPKGAVDLALLLVMWWIMMIGMMLPSAAPMILTFATVNARRRAHAQPWVPTTLFVAADLPARGGLRLGPSLAHHGPGRGGLPPRMALPGTGGRRGGVRSPAAGRYQLTPLKHACLIAFRSPFDFV